MPLPIRHRRDRNKTEVLLRKQFGGDRRGDEPEYPVCGFGNSNPAKHVTIFFFAKATE